MDSIRHTPLNVVLIGFMGSGKTTIGARLASLLGFEFVDTDSLIVAKAGKDIPKIFQEQGEDGFRQLESATLRDLLGRDHLVISTGGGIVTREENCALLREIGLIVHLTTSDVLLWSRVKRNRDRPLLHTPEPRKTFDELLEKRRPLYDALADLVVDTRGLSPEEAAYGLSESVRVHFCGK